MKTYTDPVFFTSEELSRQILLEAENNGEQHRNGKNAQEAVLLAYRNLRLRILEDLQTWMRENLALLEAEVLETWYES